MQNESDELLDSLRTGSKPEIGVTNRIRTGTNAFTGRDASCYIMITINGAPSRTRTDDYEFTKLALLLLRHRGVENAE